MNQLVLKQVLKTIKHDLAVAHDPGYCPGCRELATVRSSALVNSLLNIVERDAEPQPIFVLRGGRFVARYTLNGQEGA